MGSSQPTAAIFNGNFQSKAWTIIGQKSNDMLNQPFLVKLSGQELYAWQYLITLKPGDTFQKQSKIYRDRASSQTNHLVNILSAQLLNEKYELTGEKQIVRVRTQEIVWTLTDSQSLTLEQCLYILEGTCKGFSQINEHFQIPFQVYSDMIGMNKLGTIRVWLNPNFATNGIKSYRQKLPSIQLMKKNIIELISNKFQSKCFPYKQQLLSCPNFFTVANMASALLLKVSTKTKKVIGMNILQNAKISKMLVRHYLNKSIEKKDGSVRRSRSIFEKKQKSFIQDTEKTRAYLQISYNLKKRENPELKSPLQLLDNNKGQYISRKNNFVTISPLKNHKKFQSEKKYQTLQLSESKQTIKTPIKPLNKTVVFSQRKQIYPTKQQLTFSVNFTQGSNSYKGRQYDMLAKKRFNNQFLAKPESGNQINYSQQLVRNSLA